MKVLFLDIDGVCNSRDKWGKHIMLDGRKFMIDIDKVEIVKRIQRETECELVLSSTWRLTSEDVACLNHLGLNFLGLTPRLPIPDSFNNRERGQEVLTYLMADPMITRYACLDDESDFFDWQPLFKTSFETGLTDEIADAVINYLNNDNHA